MNWRRGLFRLWLAVSALRLIIVAVLFYPQVVSPYIEPRAYILTDDLKFFELDNVSDSEDRDFKAAYQTEVEFPNKVTLFAKDDTPKPVLDTQSKSFYEQHVKPREAELATARWQSLERASATRPSTTSSVASAWIGDRLDSERLQDYGPEILMALSQAAHQR
jgi:hypothetical protein